MSTDQQNITLYLPSSDRCISSNKCTAVEAAMSEFLERRRHAVTHPAHSHPPLLAAGFTSAGSLHDVDVQRSSLARQRLDPCSIPAHLHPPTAPCCACGGPFHLPCRSPVSPQTHLSNAVLHCRSFLIHPTVADHFTHTDFTFPPHHHQCYCSLRYHSHPVFLTISPFAAGLRASPALNYSQPRAKPSWAASPANSWTFIEASVHLCEAKEITPADPRAQRLCW